MVSLAALIIAILFGGYVASLVMTARSVPPIHDVTTNMDSVPRFFRLTLREDNFEVVPPEGDPRLIRMTPVDRWRTLHQDAYGDLVTLQVPWRVDVTVRRAEAAAPGRCWEIARHVPCPPRVG